MVFEKVCTLLSQILSCDESRISMRTVILLDLEASAEDLSDFYMALDEEFGVSWDEDITDEISTIADLVKLIEDSI